MLFMDDNRLQRIQSLQFQDRPAAETLLLEFVRETFPDLAVTGVELRPLAVSLNSFNGFLNTASSKKFFFKTHVEPRSVIDEYYNSELLAKVGYPIILPEYKSTEYGKQFLIYKVIESPSVFDVARAIEHGERSDLAALSEAQHKADDDLLQIYLKTLEWQSAEDAAKAPVHQLFYHRLGERYRQFYENKPFVLPGGLTLQWEDLLQRRWVINGVEYAGTLAQAIDRARIELNPAQPGWSVIGHGDAHNGNVFFTPEGLVYFDPAFGGRHHPFLDLTKPMFHNVFATWMYHPQEIAQKYHIQMRDDGVTIHVEHDHVYPDFKRNDKLASVRVMFLLSKIERVLRGLVEELAHRQNDHPNRQGKQYLRSALMCCPLLTMNLADRNRFPPEVGLLGLSYAVAMGIESTGPNPGVLDALLAQIADLC